MKLTTREKEIEHPLEGVFDITPCTTVVEYKEVEPSAVVPMPTYDVKDDEIEGKLEEIYAVAMGSVETIGDEMERVEGKYKARIGEVTATMLNVALGAVREKAALKMHKDKLQPVTGGGPQTVNNNLVIADRNEILQMLMKKQNS